LAALAALLRLSGLPDADARDRQIAALLDGTDRETGQAVLTRAAELIRLKMAADANSLIEKLAAELVGLRLAGLLPAEADERIAAVLGDADRDVAQGALDRAGQIMTQRAAASARLTPVIYRLPLSLYFQTI
jgi:hypothetical protein